MNMVFSQTTLPTASSIPWLTLLVAWPLVFALVLWLVKPLRPLGREIALAVSLVELAGVLVAAATSYNPAAAPAFQLGESYPWIPAIGLSWALGVNGLGLVMIILATALTPLVILSSWREDQDADARAGYAGLILGLEACMVLIFTARDLLLFYLTFEAMLVPLYFLVGRFGHGEAARRRHAAIKFVLYSLAGGLVMLFGVIAVYVGAAPVTKSPAGLFHMDNLTALDLGSNPLAYFTMWTFLLAFAIKAPMVPVHTWLPTTAAVARGGTSVLLVGVLDKVGTWGMIMFCWQLFPAASAAVAPLVIALAVISILWGALAAIASKDLMRLVSFTSISHFGFMVMALYIGSQTAIEGAMLYMVAHGVSIAGMFLLSGWLTERGGTQEIAAYSGFQRVTPTLAGLFLTSGLAAIGLPGLSGFLPEYLILVGTFKVSLAAALFAVLGVVLAAVYLLLPYQNLFTGPTDARVRTAPDLGSREKLIMVPVILAMLGLGFLPGPTLDLMKPDAAEMYAVQSPHLGSMGTRQMAPHEKDAANPTENHAEGSTK
ncbi:complex I subunit 4 family protein [Mobiluncus mulieris]|uniref:complex I subunit 4 family protein n=1 Tax=Mobiluncus mulieris TaxID=2052 RepID=UPI0021E2C34F|nr:NADH-quinone oxidoreductase subunit M [Mobiluncus mulieris]MCV0002831.1 NADH-quinone oxidoreductase subunit M [Mobiluncus mulieris]